MIISKSDFANDNNYLDEMTNEAEPENNEDDDSDEDMDYDKDQAS